MRGAALSPSEKTHSSHALKTWTALLFCLGASCSRGSVLDRDSVHAFNDTVDLFTVPRGTRTAQNTATMPKIDYLSLEWSREV